MKHTLLLLSLLITGVFCGISQPAQAGDLKLAETDEVIRVTLRGKPVLEYVKTEKPAPDGIEPHFRRSGYIHPVYTPTGQELTGDFPADHAHQHALFFAWTKSAFNGQKTDFWNQAKDLGRVEFREVVGLKREERRVSFSVKHAFKVKMRSQAGEKWVDVLHEIWTVTVHQTPDDHFLFDIASVQECATDKPLILPEYRYGGMAIRGNYQWLKEKEDHSINPGDLVFLTSEGKDRWEGNHTKPNWVAFSGKIDGQEVSAAVFCNPKNFRAPQTVRIHPNKPYFCFAPMVDGPFNITPGKKYVSRYRYLVTSEKVDVKDIERRWRQYAKRKELIR
jgi:hypothetical protein